MGIKGKETSLGMGGGSQPEVRLKAGPGRVIDASWENRGTAAGTYLTKDASASGLQGTKVRSD